jgi:hypothetical protein
MHITDLTDDESAALLAYKAASDAASGGSFCFEVNDLLQSGLWTDELPKQFRNHVVALDRVFSRCPVLEGELTAYRGTGFVGALGTLRPGRHLRSLSFLSATISCSVARGFVKSPFKGSAGAILTLHLPRGLPVCDMESLEGAGGTERELLLPRGLLWKIVDIKKGEVSGIPAPSNKNFTSLGLITLQAVSPTARPLT